MADLSDVQAAGITRLTGSDATGVEQTPVQSTSSGGLHSNLRDDAGVEISQAGTPALSSSGLVVRPIPYEPQTYSAAADGFTVAATPTDVFTITGSASKTIRIHKIRITGTTTSGSAIKLKVSLYRRSTADSAGTRVAATVVPHDTTNAAGTATVGHYTANPTLGTSAGVMRSASVGITASGLAGGDLVFDFVGPEGQPITLRGTSQQIAVNFNSISIAGSVIAISVEWSEV